MKRDIVLDSDKRIREVSKSVDLNELGTPLFKELCNDLVDTLNGYRYGVGISAIQIGVPKRIFLIQKSDRDGKRELPKFYINPEIVNTSEKSVKYYEACLSVNYAQTFGEVSRKYWIRILYWDENGIKHEEKLDGIDARIVFHEIDHLDGKLFMDIVDRSTIKDLDEYMKYLKKKL